MEVPISQLVNLPFCSLWETKHQQKVFDLCLVWSIPYWHEISSFRAGHGLRDSPPTSQIRVSEIPATFFSSCGLLGF